MKNSIEQFSKNQLASNIFTQRVPRHWHTSRS